jgi:hypothetical protein
VAQPFLNPVKTSGRLLPSLFFPGIVSLIFPVEGFRFGLDMTLSATHQTVEQVLSRPEMAADFQGAQMK